MTLDALVLVALDDVLVSVDNVLVNVEDVLVIVLVDLAASRIFHTHQTRKPQQPKLQTRQHPPQARGQKQEQRKARIEVSGKGRVLEHRGCC